MKKYRVYMALIFAVVVCGAAVCFAGIFAPSVLGVDSKTGLGVGAGALVLSLLLSLALQKPMNRAREVEEYDEFGVKKKTTKFDMDSSHRKELEAEALARMEAILPRDTVAEATHEGSKNPMAELENLVGLSPVKEIVKNVAARLEFESVSLKKSSVKTEGHHAVFYGNPGTGKTTVARILAGILYEFGYCSKNKCVEFSGNDLVAKSAAETSIKVRAITKAAYGGVLFVDEAYTLASHPAALAALIKEMEDNRDKFTLILAGYQTEMTKLMNANPGLRSRFSEFVPFPDYSAEELRSIAEEMAHKKDFVFAQDALLVFDKRMETERRLDSWGNARTVRSVVEESVNNHAASYIRNSLPKSLKYVVLASDVSEYSKATI